MSRTVMIALLAQLCLGWNTSRCYSQGDAGGGNPLVVQPEGESAPKLIATSAPVQWLQVIPNGTGLGSQFLIQGLQLNREGLLLTVLADPKVTVTVPSHPWETTVPATTVELKPLARDANTGLTLFQNPYRCLRPFTLSENELLTVGEKLFELAPNWPIHGPRLGHPAWVAEVNQKRKIGTLELDRLLIFQGPPGNPNAGQGGFGFMSANTFSPTPGTVYCKGHTIAAMVVATLEADEKANAKSSKAGGVLAANVKSVVYKQAAAISAAQIREIVGRMLAESGLPPLPKPIAQAPFKVQPKLPTMPSESVRISILYDNGEQAVVTGMVLTSQGIVVTPCEAIIGARSVKCQWLNLDVDLELRDFAQSQYLALMNLEPYVDRPHLEFDTAAPAVLQLNDPLYPTAQALKREASDSVKLLARVKSGPIPGAFEVSRNNVWLLDRELDSGTPLFTEKGQFAGLAYSIEKKSSTSFLIPADQIWIELGTVIGPMLESSESEKLQSGKQLVKAIRFEMTTPEELERISARLKPLFPEMQFSTTPVQDLPQVGGLPMPINSSTLIVAIEPNSDHRQLQSLKWLLKLFQDKQYLRRSVPVARSSPLAGGGKTIPPEDPPFDPFAPPQILTPDTKAPQITAPDATSGLQLDAQTKELIQQYQSAAPADKVTIRKELDQVVARQFDQRHQQRLNELKTLEERLNTLRSTLTRRQELKSEIVHKRVADLLSLENPIEWEPAEVTGPPSVRHPSANTGTPPKRSSDSAPIPPQAKPGRTGTAALAADMLTEPQQLTPLPQLAGSPPIKQREPMLSAFKVQGTILRIPQQDTAEISMGSDDGLKVGQMVDIFRATGLETAISGERNDLKYIGRMEITAIQADRSAAKSVTGLRLDFQQEHDVVTTDLTQAPPSAFPKDELASLQGTWKSGDPEPIYWTFDGSLCLVRTKGVELHRGTVNLGQTKTLKFIEIRNLVQLNAMVQFHTFGQPNQPNTTCFPYLLDGDQLKINGFAEFYSPTDLPAKFGGPTPSGEKSTVSQLQRATEAEARAIPMVDENLPPSPSIQKR